MLPKMTILVLGVLALFMTTGTALAGDGTDESLLKLDGTVLGGSVVYIAQDGSIWEETNGTPGLQSTQVLYKSRLVDKDEPILLM